MSFRSMCPPFVYIDMDHHIPVQFLSLGHITIENSRFSELVQFGDSSAGIIFQKNELKLVAFSDADQ